MKRMVSGKICLLLVICMCFTFVNVVLPNQPIMAAGETIIIEHDTNSVNIPEYSEKSFIASGVEGYAGTAKGSRATATKGGYAKWTPSSLAPGVYKVYIWNVVRSEKTGGRDPSVQVDVFHNGKTDTYTLNQTEGPGWVELGEYEFAGTGDEYVKLTKTTPTGHKDADDKQIFAQADSVKFEKISGSSAPVVSSPKPSPAAEQKVDIKVTIEDSKIYVDKCGAKPNDEIDDGPFIRKAIEAAIANGPGTKVVFSPGKYIIGPPETQNQSGVFNFRCENAKGLTLQGENTILSFTDNFTGGFIFVDSSDITLKGLIVDYEKAPWAQGQVTAVDEVAGTFDYAVEDGYTVLDDSRFHDILKVGFGTIMDPANPHLLKATAPDFFRITSAVKMDQNNYKITMVNNAKYLLGKSEYIDVGDKIVLNNRGMIGTSYRFVRSSNITLDDCGVYASPGTVITGESLDGYLNINRLKAIRKPDSGRWINANADGIHLQSSKGSVMVKDCIFEGIMDDIMNFYQMPVKIKEIYSPTRIWVTHSSRVPVKGENIAIYDPENGAIRGKTKVTAVEEVGNDPAKQAILVLETAIDGMTVKVGDKLGDNIYSMDAVFPNSVISGNIFRDSRRYGLMLRTANTVIENNVFENLGGPAINHFFSTTAGPWVEKMVISGNTIDNTAFLDSNKRSRVGAAVRIFSYKNGNTTADERINNKIIIKDNTIKHVARYGIFINSTENVIISGNVIQAFLEDKPADSDIAIIRLVNVKDVNIDGLRIIDPRMEMEKEIDIGPDCENVNATNVNRVFADEESEKNFEDIQEHWAKEDIIYMVSKGIVNGIVTRFFATELNITRAEFVALIVRSLNEKTEKYKEVFKDISAENWYADTIQTANDIGLIDPVMLEDGSFMPEIPINREEMTSFIVKAYYFATKQTPVEEIVVEFEDKDNISSWALNYVNIANKLEIIKGISEKQFGPKDNATRAQAVVMIKRLLDKIK